MAGFTSIARTIIVCLVLASPFVPAGAVRADEPTEPEDGGTIVRPPEIILRTQKPPVYPPAAQAARFSGTVTVEAKVLKTGKVSEVKVLECSKPNLGFEQATIEAVKQWRFEPAQRAGEPVEYAMKFRLSFRRGPRGTERVTAGSVSSDEGATPGLRSGSAGATATPK